MFTLPADKTANGAVAYVDAKGNPAQVQGSPVWSSSDPSIVDVVASADGFAATLTPGAVGVAQVKVEADADLGDGVVPVVGLVDVEVIAGQAVAGNVTLSIA